MVQSQLLPVSIVSIELGMSAERLRRVLQARSLGQIIAGRYFVEPATVEMLRTEIAKPQIVSAGGSR